MATPTKFDLPQGTLDLLILRVVAQGPVHGYAIAQRIQSISRLRSGTSVGALMLRTSTVCAVRSKPVSM